MIRAGLLRCKVRILAPTNETDDYGDQVQTWTPIEESPRRASIRPLTLRDQERLANDGTMIQAEVTHHIKMRYWPDLDPSYRLEGVAPANIEGRTWEIASRANVAERCREYDILAREVL